MEGTDGAVEAREEEEEAEEAAEEEESKIKNLL